MVVGILQQILKISNVCIMMLKQNEKSKIVQNKPPIEPYFLQAHQSY